MVMVQLACLYLVKEKKSKKKERLSNCVNFLIFKIECAFISETAKRQRFTNRRFVVSFLFTNNNMSSLMFSHVFQSAFFLSLFPPPILLTFPSFDLITYPLVEMGGFGITLLKEAYVHVPTNNSPQECLDLNHCTLLNVVEVNHSFYWLKILRHGEGATILERGFLESNKPINSREVWVGPRKGFK